MSKQFIPQPLKPFKPLEPLSYVGTERIGQRLPGLLVVSGVSLFQGCLCQGFNGRERLLKVTESLHCSEFVSYHVVFYRTA